MIDQQRRRQVVGQPRAEQEGLGLGHHFRVQPQLRGCTFHGFAPSVGGHGNKQPRLGTLLHLPAMIPAKPAASIVGMASSAPLLCFQQPLVLLLIPLLLLLPRRSGCCIRLLILVMFLAAMAQLVLRVMCYSLAVL